MELPRVVFYHVLQRFIVVYIFYMKGLDIIKETIVKSI